MKLRNSVGRENGWRMVAVGAALIGVACSGGGAADLGSMGLGGSAPTGDFVAGGGNAAGQAPVTGGGAASSGVVPAGSGSSSAGATSTGEPGTAGTPGMAGAGPTAVGGAGTAGAGTGGAAGGDDVDVGGAGGAGGADTMGDAGMGAGGAEVGGTDSGGSGGEGGVELDPDAVFVSPDGVMGAAGTLDAPTTLADALGRVNAGETIYLRGGIYALNSTVDLSQSGSDGAPIRLSAYPLDDDRPLFDFSGMAESSSNRGVSLSGDYWHVYGIDLSGAGDNCMFVSGSDNVIEYATFSECSDTGLQLGNGAADNLVLNCDSYFNADSALENADGFAAKLDVGSGNKFVGCRAWNNLDDGWDGYLRDNDNVTTTYESCWALDNGKLANGSVGAGDGNGFKTGGSDDKDLHHNATYTWCIAAGNVHDGFDHNSNRGSITILNSAAHDNGSNFNFSSSNIAASLTIKNAISVGDSGDLNATAVDITNNSWQGGLLAMTDDFVSLDTSLLKSPRKSDGSLPDVDYLMLVSGSDLRNAGIDLGLPYNGAAPDLGPFESDE